ncbi:MAG: DsbA family protein, partial [Planctomycetota bacterium]
MRMLQRPGAPPRTLAVLDTGSDPQLGVPFVAIELLAGEELRAYLQQIALAPATGAAGPGPTWASTPAGPTAPGAMPGSALGPTMPGAAGVTMPGPPGGPGAFGGHAAGGFGAPPPPGGYGGAPLRASAAPPPPRSSSSGTVFLLLGLAFVALLLVGGGGAAYWMLSRRGADVEIAEPEQDEIKPVSEGTAPVKHQSAAVPVFEDDPFLGTADAPVTIVVYSDFQCPFCKRVEPTLSNLHARYGNDLRIVWKDFALPFHKDAPAAHPAGRVVYELGGSKAFFRFRDLAFANQKDLQPSNFEDWAQQAGVSGGAFREHSRSKAQQKLDDTKAEAKRVGVRGTPAFFVNGVPLSGAQPQSKFETVVDEQLKLAKQRLSPGTARDRVYVELTNENFKQPSKPSSKGAKPPPDTTTVFKVPVFNDDPVLGKRLAKVTIVEFSDFQCPFCTRAAKTVAELKRHYGDDLRVVWKDNPLSFHKRAKPAARFAREAFAQKGDDGFWKAHDLLFDNQKALEDSDLRRYATQLGLDVAKVSSALGGTSHDAVISRSQELAEALDARGTPNFFINGRNLRGAQPLDKFKSIVDEELRRADALLAAGTAPDRLYQELIKNGKSPKGGDLEKRDAGAIPADAPFLGAAGAKVVIQEFSDFQCPFCKRVNGTLKELLREYDGRVKL